MKFSSLQTIKKLRPLKSLIITKSSYLSEIEFINYSISIGLYATKILEDKIKVSNKNEILSLTFKEIKNLNTLLSENIHKNTITKREAKKTFKRLEIKPRHLKI